jgi:hypothetical protein
MAAFDRSLSPDRLKTYMVAAGFKADLAVALYLWNVAIGQSFHFPLQCAEVSLRNVTHAVLADKYGADWWRDQPCRQMLGGDATKSIDKAEQRHRKIYGGAPTTGHIVASLTMGFWVFLLKRQYHRPLWDQYAGLAFPHVDGQEDIFTIKDTGFRILELRNRIFHHEPLIGHNLLGDYAAISKLLGWICPETRDWMKDHTSVPRVIRQRPK